MDKQIKCLYSITIVSNVYLHKSLSNMEYINYLDARIIKKK